MTKGELAELRTELRYAEHRLLLLRVYQKNVDEQRAYYERRTELLKAKLEQEDLRPLKDRKNSASATRRQPAEQEDLR